MDEACYEGFRNAVFALGTLDALLALAAVAKLPGYVRPVYRTGSTGASGDDGVGAITSEGDREESREGDGGAAGGDAIVLRAARHPTVERVLEGGFVPNDVDLRCIAVWSGVPLNTRSESV